MSGMDLKQDIEVATKAMQCAALLCGDIADLERATNPLVASLANDLLSQAGQLHIRLKQLKADLETLSNT